MGGQQVSSVPQQPSMPSPAGQHLWPATQQPSELVEQLWYLTPQISILGTQTPLLHVEVALHEPQEPPQPLSPHALPAHEPVHGGGGGQAPTVAPLLSSFFFFFADA